MYTSGHKIKTTFQNHYIFFLNKKNNRQQHDYFLGFTDTVDKNLPFKNLTTVTQHPTRCLQFLRTA